MYYFDFLAEYPDSDKVPVRCTSLNPFLFESMLKDVSYKMLHDDESPDKVVCTISRSV